MSEHQKIERRALVRHERSFESACRPIFESSLSSWGATLADISTVGIGIRLDRQFKPGTRLLIEVGGGEAISFQARVVRARLTPQGYFEIGCRFARELDEEDLQKLL